MLRLTTNTTPAAAKRYYTEGLARSDYYLAVQVEPGFWGGKAATLLGLAGQVSRRDFFRLCDNQRPDGSQLTPRTKANRRVGYDLNFHCPKSLSLVHAFGGDDRIVVAFREAVAETMALIETDAATRIRQAGRSEDRATGNLVWGTFIHDTTRPVDGVPDPHLHAHCFVFNATFDRTEDRWKAAQLGRIKSDAPYYEACFHATLSSKLRELGYGIRREGKFWGLTAVPADLVRRFSNRTVQIDATAAALGLTDADLKAGLGATTRSRKGTTKPWPEVQRHWQARLSESDFIRLREARRSREREPEDLSPSTVLDTALRTCVERTALVPERLLLETALRNGVGHVHLNSLKALIPRLGLESREIRGVRHLVDDARYRDEKAVLAFVAETRGLYPPFLHVTTPPAGVPTRDQESVRWLYRSSNLVALFRAKPVTRDVVVADLQRTGHTVIRMSAASRDPIAEMPTRESLRGPLDNPVLFVDYAERLGIAHLAELVRRVDETAVRVVLAQSPGRSSPHSPLRLLLSRGGLSTPKHEAAKEKQAVQAEVARLPADENVAKAPDAEKALQSAREGVQWFTEAQGLLTPVLARLDRLGELRQLPPEKFAEGLADAYVAKQKTAKSARVIVNDSEMAQAVTKLIRQNLRGRKKLGRPRKFEQLRRVLFDEEDRRNPLNYHRGQVVVFFKSAKGFRLGKRYEVVGRDMFGHVLAMEQVPRKGLLKIPARIPRVEALPLDKPDRFGVFERAEIELAKGDMIRTTLRGATLTESFGPEKLLPVSTRVRNQRLADAFHLKTPDRRYRVEKDTYHRITGFTLGGHLQLANGWVISKDFGHLEHGYCGHGAIPFLKAGVQAQLQTKTRGELEMVTLYTNDKDAALAAAAALDNARETARQMEPQPVISRSATRNRGREMDHER